MQELLVKERDSSVIYDNVEKLYVMKTVYGNWSYKSAEKTLARAISFFGTGVPKQIVDCLVRRTYLEQNFLLIFCFNPIDRTVREYFWRPANSKDLVFTDIPEGVNPKDIVLVTRDNKDFYYAYPVDGKDRYSHRIF